MCPWKYRDFVGIMIISCDISYDQCNKRIDYASRAEPQQAASFRNKFRFAYDQLNSINHSNINNYQSNSINPFEGLVSILPAYCYRMYTRLYLHGHIAFNISLPWFRIIFVNFLTMFTIHGEETWHQ